MLLRSPLNDRDAVTLPTGMANLQVPFNGELHSEKGSSFSIKNNIADLLVDDHPYSLAQKSNHFQLTASIYENTWRKRSMKFLTGKEFPISDELELLTDWMQPVNDGRYLDVGCSTALYARGLKKASPKSIVAALDISRPMLRQAKEKAKAEGINLFLIRADARKLPFFEQTFHGLMMGGSLNEFSDELKVLFECRRVIKQGGTLFMMHLLRANTFTGKRLQDSAKLGGIQFWTLDESNNLFERSGFAIEKQAVNGVVCFSKLKAR